MGLTKVEQAEALKLLLKEDYRSYGRLIEDSRAITREAKIDLLYKALVLADLRTFAPDDEVQEAREDITQAIVGDADVLLFRRPKEDQA